MKTFKNRLKTAGKALLAWVICIAVIVLFGWLFALIPTAIMNWIAYTILSLLGLGIVWSFVYWLFIEPFKIDKRRKDKDL